MVEPLIIFSQKAFLKPYTIIYQQRTFNYFTPGTIIIGIFVNQITVNIRNRAVFRRHIIIKTTFCNMSIRLKPFFEFIINYVRIAFRLICECLKDRTTYQIVIAINETDIVSNGVFKAGISSAGLSLVMLMNYFNSFVFLAYSSHISGAQIGATVIHQDYLIISKCLS